MKYWKRSGMFLLIVVLIVSLVACSSGRSTLSMTIERERDEDGYRLLPVQIEMENLTSESNFFTIEIAKGAVKEEFSSSRQGELSVLYLPLNRSLTVELEGEDRDISLDTHFYFLENKEMDGVKTVNGDYYFYVKENAKSATLRLVFENSSWRCEFVVQR